MPPLDMSKYLGLFVSEATEHLEAMGRDLVELEKVESPDAVDSLFRHAHSVKGMSSSMGYEPIAQLAHRAEDLVEALRKEPYRKSRELVDLLLAAADMLLSQVRAAGEGTAIDPAHALLESLSQHVTLLTGSAPAPTRVATNVVVTRPAPTAPGQTPGAGTPAAPPAPGAAPTSEPVPAEPQGPLGVLPRFAVRLRVLPTCQAPGVRAFLVHRRLSMLGNLFDLKPPLEDLKAGRLPDGRIALEIETSGGGDAVDQVLRNIPEVEVTSVAPVVYGQPPPSAPAAQEGPKPVGVEPQRSVRVRTDLLDLVLDSVGELMLATARIRELAKGLPEAHRPSMEEGIYRVHQLVRDLHGKVMSVRMTPLSTITDRLPRAARDLARKMGREVDLVIAGAEIELDRAILDELADPLLHILRNCIDHGLETPEQRAAASKGARGRILITVRRARDRVVVEIEDDGRGMDAAKLKAAAIARDQITAEHAARLTDREALMLACLPGVSTARDISEISGRGVGMDAVKRVVEGVGGTLELDSERGRGTRITLRLPLTVAVVNLLLVRLGAEIYGLPITKVAGAMEMDPQSLSQSLGEPMLPHGTALVPVRELSALLGVAQHPPKGPRPYVVMEADPGRVALAVDGLLGQEEAVLKPLAKPLDLVPGLSGVTILGTGRPVFILDVPRLLA